MFDGAGIDTEVGMIMVGGSLAAAIGYMILLGIRLLAEKRRKG